MRTYECTPGFGWGIRGAAVSGINRKLRELGLKNEHPNYWPKLHELVSPFPVKVTGDKKDVDAFEEYMLMMGYDTKLTDNKDYLDR